MDWLLFLIASAVWVFFTEHHVWTLRFKQMSEHGLQVPAAVPNASNLLGNLSALNLVAFFIVYGLRVSWLWGAVIVFGSYALGLAYLLISARHYGTFLHKLGWAAMPVLSIGIWLVAFIR